MAMDFLYNTWYLAAWAGEVTQGQLFHRRIANLPVLIYRRRDGTAVALEDRCPHRFAPLHMGKLVGEDLVQCPYHGLQFNSDGACAFNPQGAIPSAARVRAFPLLDRFSGLWIWMGDPQRADPDLMTPFEMLRPEVWHVGAGYLHIRANYQLESDNILDLSHIEFLHPMFASEAVRSAKVQAAQEGDAVWCRRFMTRDRPPTFIYQGFGIPEGEEVDRWLDVRWTAPASMVLTVGAVISGQPPQQGRELKQAHIFTPETSETTHYFYSVSFPRAMGERGAQLARDSVETLRGPFESEDKPIVEAIARNMEGRSFWENKPILLHGDTAAILARRILAKKIAAEQESSSAQPHPGGTAN